MCDCRRFASRIARRPSYRPDGLILTNHHCVEQCLARAVHEGQEPDGTRLRGAESKEEQRCPAQQADVLVGTENITDAVLKSGAGLERCGCQSCAQEDADLARTSLRTSEREGQIRQARMPSGQVVSRRPVLSLQVQAIYGRTHGVCSGDRYRRFRRRSGQFSVSALVSGFLDPACLREQQTREDAQLSANQLCRTQPPTNWCSSPAILAQRRACKRGPSCNSSATYRCPSP